MTISDIAYQVGYDTPSSLTKSFCKLFGISPKEYRLTKSYQIMSTQSLKSEVKLSRVKIVEQEAKTVLYISASGNYSNVDLGSIKVQQTVKKAGIHTTVYLIQ